MEKAKEMTDISKIIVEPRRQMRINKIKMDPARADEFMKVIERAYKAKKPAKDDLQTIRKFLIDYPEYCRVVFSMTEAVQQQIIKNWGDDEVAKTAIEEHAVFVRDEMGYHDAPIMEKMLIDNIVTAWLRLQWLDYLVSAKMAGDFRIPHMEFWQKSLAMAQRNYLAACETLAKVRKMRLPNIQLNIGDKQINIAGNPQSGSSNR
jgi:hypothetical protein